MREFADRSARHGGGRVTVLAADDHPVYRDGLASELHSCSSFELLDSVDEGYHALRLIREMTPDVAVLDIYLPDLDGLAVLEAAAAEKLSTKCLILSAHGDSAAVYEAFSRGAKAFLLKTASSAEICDTIRLVARGDSVIPAAFQTGLTQEIENRRGLAERPLLSSRELQVLRLAADGLATAGIGAELSLSTATVKTHLQRVYDKLEVSDRAAAVADAMRRGLLK